MVLLSEINEKMLHILNIIWHGEHAATPVRGGDLVMFTQYHPFEVGNILDALISQQYIVDNWEMENGRCIHCFRINGDNEEKVYNMLHTSNLAS